MEELISSSKVDFFGSLALTGTFFSVLDVS